MTINGKYYTEPEAVTYIKELEAACKRYEDENRSLTDKLDEIGKAYNEQVSLVGWLEEQNKELGRCADNIYNDLIIGYKKGRCAICKRNESTGLIGRCKSCFDGSEWVWRYADKYGIGNEKCDCYESGHWYLGDDAGTCNGTKEREACNCGGDKSKCDYYKTSDQ